jgi:hypothetical protein
VSKKHLVGMTHCRLPASTSDSEKLSLEGGGVKIADTWASIDPSVAHGSK